MRRTTAMWLTCGVILGGLTLGRLGVVAPSWAWAVATGLVLATGALALAGRRRWLVGALLVAALVAGLWRAQVWRAQQAAWLGLVGQSVSLDGVVADDPGVAAGGSLNFNLGQLRRAGRPVPGQLSVHMHQTNLHRGWQVHAEGKVKPGFGNSPVELSYPKLTVVSTHQSWLEQLRQRFFVGMKGALPEPIASFALGLLVGVRALIPKALQDQLALVGLSHLVAVSGYNLTIIVAAAHRLLARLGRGVALAASLWLIGGFVLVTGASASIVRAALVSVLALLATFYGRRFQPLVLIALTAAATALYRPDFLTDLGWLLSFLAFFGIMILAPAVSARLGNPHNLLVRLFIESTAAQVMTIPIILFAFGQLSIVAPLTNLIVLPMVPLAMLLSFAAGLAGLLLPAFAGWLAWPAGLLLHFMLKLIGGFAGLPWAGTTFRIDLVTMLAMYASLLVAVLLLQCTNRRTGATELAPLAEPLTANEPAAIAGSFGRVARET
ncbi:MAG TPA: ComEC/Rec2 family competence protein [Candidatus Saccharimonadia bacterium]|nr:ComEC/Rec2 family competence protein [Candidatus Saccharimonadia bacterium]